MRFVDYPSYFPSNTSEYQKEMLEAVVQELRQFALEYDIKIILSEASKKAL